MKKESNCRAYWPITGGTMNQCVQTKDLSGFIRKANNVVEFFPRGGSKCNRVIMRGGNLNLDIGVQFYVSFKSCFPQSKKKRNRVKESFSNPIYGRKVILRTLS